MGRIAALDGIKKDVLKWFGGLAAPFGLAFAVLGYFGLNETLRSAVNQEVRAEINRTRSEIDQIKTSMFSNVAQILVELGAAKASQKELADLLSDEKRQIESLQKERATLETVANQTRQAAMQGQAESNQLRETIATLKADSILDRIKRELGHIRDFGANVEVNFAPLEEGWLGFGFGTRVEIIEVDENTPDKKEKQIAQMSSQGDMTTTSKNGKIDGLFGGYTPYRPFFSRIYGKPLENFQGVNKMRFSIYVEMENKDKLDRLVNKITSIHVDGMINRVPLWVADYSSATGTPKIDAGGPRYFVHFDLTIPDSKLDIMERYDKASR